MRTQERIDQVLASMQALDDKGAEILTAAGEAPLTAEQRTEYETHTEAASLLNEEFATLRKAEAVEAQRAQLLRPVLQEARKDKAATDDGAATIESARMNEGEPAWVQGNYGLALAAHCMYRGENSHQAAAHYARNVLKDEAMAKVMDWYGMAGKHADLQQAALQPSGTTTDADFVAPLVSFRRAQEQFIEQWRAATIVGRLGMIRLSFAGDASLTIPRKNSGTVGSWVGEANAIPVGAISLDDITLTAKQQATIVVLTQKAIDHTSPAALGLVQADLVEGAAQNTDETFLDTTASNPARPAGGFNAATIVAGAAGADIAALDTDIKAALNHFDGNNIPATGMAWLFHPTKVRDIQFMRDSNGNRYYPEIGGGVLEGVQVIASTSVDATTLNLVAGGQFIMADDHGPTVDMSNDASLHMDTAPDPDIGGGTTEVANMFQTDSVAIRMRQGYDFAKRRNIVAYRRTAVTW